MSEHLLTKLEEAVMALRALEAAREQALGDYAEGDVPERLRALQARLSVSSRELREACERLGLQKTYRGGTPLVLGEQLMPDAIVKAYETLYTRCYGGGGSFIGDPNSESIVPQEWFTKSEQQQTRGVAKPGSKKYSSSVKSVLKNERAFDLKSRIDKRLRKLAKDIYAEMEGQGEEETIKCMSCHKIAQREWKWCPRCGDRLVRN